MDKSEIRDRRTGAVLFALEQNAVTIKNAVEAAVKSYANLSGADLSGADLSGAVLSGATHAK